MDPRTATTGSPDPDAVGFIRFCYHRRRVGWPELYDEMCAVAGRGLYRGYGSDDLAALGIGFSLFDMPALAALANRIVAEELAARKPVTVTLAPAGDTGGATGSTVEEAVAAVAAVIAPDAVVVTTLATSPAAVASSGPTPELPAPSPSLRFASMPSGA